MTEENKFEEDKLLREIQENEKKRSEKKNYLQKIGKIIKNVQNYHDIQETNKDISDLEEKNKDLLKLLKQTRI